MKEKKNLDRLFQEKFKDFEAHPSDQVWKNIVAAKAKKNEDRKVAAIWWRLGGVAALLLVLITTGFVLWNTTSNDEITNDPALVEATQTDKEENTSSGIANTDDSTEKSEKLQQSETPTEAIADVNKSQNENNSSINTPEEENRFFQDKKKQNDAVAGQNKTTTNQQLPNQGRVNDPRNVIKQESTTITGDIAQNKGTTTNNNSNKPESQFIDPTVDTGQNTTEEAIATTAGENKEETQDANATDVVEEIIEEPKKSLVEEAARIAANETEEEETQEKEAIARRWDVGAVAAPVFYGDFGGSGIDPQFKDNSKTSDVNLSYGVQVSYAVNSKFKVRTGVSNVDLNYNTQDISFSPSNNAATLRGVDFSQSASFLNITDRVDPSTGVASPQDGLGQGGNTVSNGEIQQNVGYIEIPLEAVYVLSDKRLGVELIGGISTLLLNNNEVFLESNGLRTSLGTSNALNDVSFTTNVGLGLNYKLTEKIKVNVEPSLKYQLNAYSNSVGEFKPYYVGIYTGVNYRF